MAHPRARPAHAALQTGQALINVLPDQIQTLQASKNVRIEKTPSRRIISFTIVRSWRPIADRRGGALNHAVDMQGPRRRPPGNGKRI
jgi:hypothetical protein